MGYELHETYRRGQDAVVVAYKRELFAFKGKEVVDYNELVKLLEGARDFKVNNKALICHLEHVSEPVTSLSDGNRQDLCGRELPSLLGPTL